MAEPPADWTPYLGRKVSIRFRLAGDPAHPFSEAIGVVSNVTDRPDGARSISIVTRSGDTVEVAVADILAAKVFPL